VRSFEAGALLDSVIMLVKRRVRLLSEQVAVRRGQGWTRLHHLVIVAQQSPRQAFGPSADHDLAMG
jgi:hypothetical protein